MMMMGNGAMGWMGVIWPLLVATGLLVLVYLGYRLIAPPRDEDPLAGKVSSARRILDERYARGEIDEQEYRRRRSELGT